MAQLSMYPIVSALRYTGSDLTARFLQVVQTEIDVYIVSSICDRISSFLFHFVPSGLMV